MHSGQTSGPDCARPMLDLAGRAEGARSADGKVMGCYLHGLFAADAFRRAFLGTLGARAANADYEARIETTLNELADHLEAHIDVAGLLEISMPVASFNVSMSRRGSSRRGPRSTE